MRILDSNLRSWIANPPKTDSSNPLFGLDRDKVPHRFSPEYVPEPGPPDRETAFGLVAEMVGLPDGSMADVLARVQLMVNAAGAK